MTKAILLLVLTTGLLLACLLVGLRLGSFETSYATVLNALLHPNPADNAQYAILHLRLPRLLLAFAVGGSLAFCGYLMQAMVNNSLADPYTLGSSAGASLGANLVYFGAFPLTFFGLYMPPVLAFAGALLVTILVVLLGSFRGRIIPAQLLLAGIALNLLSGALISLLTFLSDSEGKLRAIVFWTMGGFERAGWNNVGYPLGAIGMALLLFVFLQKQLHILLLGEARAETLGVNTRATRWLVLVATAIVTGAAVAVSGPIGFVGLIIPHVIRALLGATGPLNLVCCVLLGGAFLMGCDLLARVLYPPAGIPVGIVTALFGVPFFVYLLSKKSYRFEA